MPAVSERQRKFMGAELARKRAGKKTQTGMSESQLSDFASKPNVHTARRQSAESAVARDMKRPYTRKGRTKKFPY